MQSDAWGASAASEASGWEFSIFKLRHEAKANERRPETSVTWLPDAEPSFQTPLKICVLHLSTRNCRSIQIMVITRISFFGRKYFNKLETCIFPLLGTLQMDDPNAQLIEVDGWSNHWKIRNGDESVSGGTGPWTSISFPPRRFQLFGDVWSLCWHFSRSCITFNFPSFQFLNKHIFGNMMMFWFLFDRHFHTKKLPLWWMILSQFTGSLSFAMTSRS